LDDGANEESDVGDGGKDQSLFSDEVVDKVIVSARTRGTKRPWALGCVFHASVVERWVFEMK
jgi:hypothetical protein